MGTVAYFCPEQVIGDGPRRPLRHLLARRRALRVPGRRAAVHRRGRSRSCTASSTRSPQPPPRAGRGDRRGARGHRPALPARRSPASGPSGPARSPRRCGATARGCATAIAGACRRAHRGPPRPAPAASLPFIGRREGIGGAPAAAQRRHRWRVPVRRSSAASPASARRGCSKSSRTSPSARQIRVLHGRFVEQDRGLPYQGVPRDDPRSTSASRGLEQRAGSPTSRTSRPTCSRLFPMLAEVAEIRAAAAASPGRPTPVQPRRRAARRSSSCWPGR